MIKATRGQKIDTVFVLIIFCVFAVSVLLVLALGANIYKNMTDVTREEYDERTALSYVWTRVKNSDESGSVSAGDFKGVSALFIDEEYGQTKYRTAIYTFNGRLNVLFSEEGLEFEPEDGVPVMEVEDMAFSALEDGIIKVSAGGRSLLLFPRSGTTGTFERGGGR